MMDNKNEVKFTTHDRLLRAWENSMELVRDFQFYSDEVEDHQVSNVFAQFAEDEGVHAAKLRELLMKSQDNRVM